jgi:hypothetical protein
MNRFCWKCEFKEIPTLLKQKFNIFGARIFVDECPLDDDRVKGCTTKIFHKVNWNEFCKFLLTNNLLITEEERKIAERYIASGEADSQGIFRIP